MTCPHPALTRTVRSLLLCCLVFAFAVSTGCGESGSSPVGGGAGGASGTSGGSSGGDATIVVFFGGQGRATPPSASQAAFVGTDAVGDVQFGPYTTAMASAVTLQRVPVSVVSLLIVTGGSQRVVSVNNHPVSLAPLGITYIYDPVHTSPGLSSLAVSPVTSSLSPGIRQQMTAMGSFSDGSVQDLTAFAAWTSSSPAVAQVSATAPDLGMVLAIAPGTTAVTAAAVGVTGTGQVSVTSKSLTEVQVSPVVPRVPAGQVQAFHATGVFSDQTVQDLTGQAAWNSSHPSVAQFSDEPAQAGVATTSTAGTSSMTASVTGVTGATDLVVQPATLVSIQVTPPATALAKGRSVQLTAMGLFSNNVTRDITSYVQWTSSDPACCVVSTQSDSQGLVFGVGTGQAVITAAALGVSGTARLRVTPAVLESLQVTPSPATVASGHLVRLRATGTFSDATVLDMTHAVSWASSDPSIAFVANLRRARGITLGRQPGTATVTAVDPASGIRSLATVRVTAAVLTRILVTPAHPRVAAGQQQKFTAIAIFSDFSRADVTQSLTWTSSAPTIATVSNETGQRGTADTLTPGQSTITATDPTTGTLGATKLTVTSAVLTSLTIVAPSSAVPVGQSLDYHAEGTYSDSSTRDVTGQVTWSSQDPSIAAVSNDPSHHPGRVAGLAVGSTSIRATDPTTGIQTAVPLEVLPATLVSLLVVPGSPTVACGTPVQFTAYGSFSDGTSQDVTSAVTWTSSQPTVATVSNVEGSSGLATTVMKGQTSITATDPVTSVTAYTTLTVTAATVATLTVTPSTPSIPAGQRIDFHASATYTDGLERDVTTEVTWTTSDTSVATISDDPAQDPGRALGLATGSTLVTAIDPASTVSGSTTLAVTPPVLASISITPQSPTVKAGTPVQFTAVGTFSDNSTLPITQDVSWSSSNPGVATISNSSGTWGQASSVSVGQTVIRAVDPATQISATTTLTTPPASPLVEFEFGITSDWGSGFSGWISITNLEKNPIHDWTLSFDFDPTIDTFDGAILVSHTGRTYVVTPASSNRTIPPGHTRTFYIQGHPGNITPDKYPTNYILTTQ